MLVAFVARKMGRGKVVLKRIENKINRQVTFSKRKNGLLKKAHELSVLCDAEAALIVFSSRGNLSEFASNTMHETLEKYWQQHYTSTVDIPGDETQTLYQEASRLKTKYESLQRSQRHLLGEELQPLTIKELHKIENQLDKALSQARQKKVQLLLERTEELNKKVRQLEDENKQLNSQVELEKRFEAAQGLGGPNIEPSEANHSQKQPSFQMGYHEFFPQEERMVNGGGINSPTAGCL